MEFEDIRIDQLDYDGLKHSMEEDDEENNIFIVPYILSANPPSEWIDFFWSSVRSSECEHPHPDHITLSVNLEPSTNMKLIGKRIMFRCRLDEKNKENAERIKLGGIFWNFVAKAVENANKEYRMAQEERKRAEVIDKQKQEQRRKSLEEAKRLLREDI